MGRTYVWSKCPYCNKTLSITSRWGSGSESKIGLTEFTICPNCKNKISNGKKEWKEMTPAEHAFEIFRFIITDICAIFIFSPIIVFLLYKLFNSNDISGFIPFSIIIAIILCVFFILGNKKIINESNKRYLLKQERLNNPEYNFFYLLEQLFSIDEILKRIERIKEIMSKDVLLISRYSKIVKDKEEVILGDFKEKKDLRSLYVYYDKFLSFLGFYYLKGQMYYYYREKNNLLIIKEVDNINNRLIDLLHNYIPEEKSEIDMQSNFQYIGELLTKKNSYINNLKKSLMLNKNINYNQLIEYLNFINLSIDFENEVREFNEFLSKLDH